MECNCEGKCPDPDCLGKVLTENEAFLKAFDSIMDKYYYYAVRPIETQFLYEEGYPIKSRLPCQKCVIPSIDHSTFSKNASIPSANPEIPLNSPSSEPQPPAFTNPSPRQTELDSPKMLVKDPNSSVIANDLSNGPSSSQAVLARVKSALSKSKGKKSKGKKPIAPLWKKSIQLRDRINNDYEEMAAEAGKCVSTIEKKKRKL